MAEPRHQEKQVKRRRWQGFALAWALPAQAAAATQWADRVPFSMVCLYALWMLAPFVCGMASFFLVLGRERPVRDGAEGFLMGAFSIAAAGVALGILSSLLRSL